MRLVATHIPSAHAAAFEFTEPGGTIGRCPGNHLLLGEDARVGRIQAVVRIAAGVLSVKNVSSLTEIMVNGEALSFLQERAIAFGDTLMIGDYMLRAGRPSDTTAASAAATQDSDAATAPPAQATEDQAIMADRQDSGDIFKELLDGPGVLPVGQPADHSKLHPFELESQAPRNHPDPIQQLRDGHPRLEHLDPAHEPLNTEPEHHGSHIFSNPVPTTLKLDDALSPQRSPIDEALAHGHASAANYENR